MHIALRGFLVLIIYCTVVACAGPQMVMRASEFNEAISSSSNELLLLNAVRAAKRFPLYYSTFGSAKGQPLVAGKSTVALPFGPDANRAYALNGEMNYNAGFQTFDLSNANTTDLNISEVLTADEYNNFLDNDWPRELVDILMIQKFELKPEAQNAILKEAGTICENAQNTRSRDAARNAALCDLIRVEEPGCTTERPQLRYFNSGINRCDFVAFQRFLRILRLIGSRIEAVKTAESPKGKGKEKTGKSSGPPKVFSLSVPKVGKQEGNGRVYFRSPEGIIVYLGQLIAAQTLSSNRSTPMIIVRSQSALSAGRVTYVPVRLFYVTKALNPGEIPVISVRHEGEEFHIPRPNYGDDNEDRSLQVLALLNAVLRTRLDGAATRPSIAYISN